MLRGEWGLLLWIARYCDQDTGRITRSQERLAKELDVSTRRIRTYLRTWRERGVIVVVRHGGGPKKQPAILEVRTRAIEEYIVKWAYANKTAPTSPEGPQVPELSGTKSQRKRLASGVLDATPEALRFRS